jgi:endonuclease I
MIRILFYTGLALALSTQIKAQMVPFRIQSGNLPASYYNAAEGLSCAPLKTALSSIISNASSTFLYADVIAAHEKTDKRRNDNNTGNIVWDMYSDNPTGNEPYTYIFDPVDRCGSYTKEGDCYNREHTFPQSWFNSELPMMSDLHHVFPTDGFVNGLRSNFPFGEVTTVSKTTLNGSKLGTGNNFTYTGTIFEPINAYKGDIARAILYMIVRYESQLPQWKNNSNANDILDGTVYPGLDAWHLKLLFKWHQQDPVSDKEKNRNDSIFVILGNRNPFIDRPEWVYQVWSCTGLITNTATENISGNKPTLIHVYPNPVAASTMNVIMNKSNPFPVQYELTDLHGRRLIKNIIPAGSVRLTVPVNGLTNGTYFVRFTGPSFIQTEKIVIANP